MTKISIIMPAYNASKFISEAIESIIRQTFKEWELLIVDDCSTDDTVNIVEEYCKKNPKISLIKREKNSGGARLPRADAALAATTELIMTFDADDFLDKDYVEKMYIRKIETQAEIVLSTLCLCDIKGKPSGKRIPAKNFNLNITLTGKEATTYLLGEVAISVSGLLVNKDIYIKNITTANSKENNNSYVDEIDQRYLLFSCKTVAFADTTYYYRQHSESLMHQTGIKRYDILNTLRVIYKFAIEHYTDKKIFQKLDNEFINNLLYCLRDYYYYNHNKSSNSNKIKHIIQQAYVYMKHEGMLAYSTKQKICTKSYHIMFAISFIYAKILKLKNK